MRGRLGRVAACARTNWRTKAALSAGLTLFFCVPYFALQRLTLFPVRTLPLSAVDRAIDFDPRWVWAYQSVYLLLTIVPWLITTRAELRRYAQGFVLLSGVGFACFLLMPIRGPRPDIDAPDVMFRLLQWYDRPLNCFPSLHVGLAVYTTLVAATVSRGRMTGSIRLSAVSLAGLWTAIIAYAALATKQHYAIDLPAGGLLAAVCHWVTWHMQRSTAHVERPMVFTRVSRGPVDVGIRERDGHAAATRAGGGARR